MTAAPIAARIDWAAWLQRWDAQQTAYLPDREERFDVMLDVLDEFLPEKFVALDLACGPGAISQRLLARFPQARSVAVDLDPVLLAMGEAALGDQGGRLRWATADLEQPDWVRSLGEERFDAVLSTTALHWLPADALVRLYSDLGALVRPGGVFLNGDNMAFASHLPTFNRLAAAETERQRVRAFVNGGAEDWDAWWSALALEPDAVALLEERTRRFANHTFHDDADAPIYDVHEAALRNAGFREVGVIWQHIDNRILLAVR